MYKFFTVCYYGYIYLFLFFDLMMPTKILSSSNNPVLKSDENIQKIYTFEELSQIGMNISANHEKERQAHIKLLKQKRIQELGAEKSSNSPIPLRYKYANLDSINTLPSELQKTLIEPYAAAQRYIEEYASMMKLSVSGRGMFFWGNVGAGKTYLACAIGNELIARGWTALYTTVTDILAMIGSARTYSNKKDESSVLKKYAEPDILIIDEIGLKKLAEYERSIICSVIDIRNRNVRPIISISNLPENQLKLDLGEMAISRLTGHGSDIINFEQDDMRFALSASESTIVQKKAPIACLDEGGTIFNLHFG